MLARSEGEFEAFQKMDLDRRREEATKGSNRQSRLVDESELPEWLLKGEEELERLAYEDEEAEQCLGRGTRQRKEVDYTDSLTEREWFKVSCLFLLSVRYLTSEIPI